MNKEIAVLLTCHNRREKTLMCLRALYRCALPENHILDIFLVDDGSSDGTASTVNKEFPAVHVLQGNGNLYWNQGMLLAWTTASSKRNFDFYLWLNDDTICETHAIIELHNASIETHHKSIIVGTTNDKNNKITYGGYLLSNNKQVIIPNGSIQACDYFNGNIVLVPQSAFSVVGLLDPIFQHGLGDFDYGLRANKLGIKTVVAPSIIGVCDGHTHEPKWLSSELSFKERYKYFKLPTGPVPFECLIFESRHLGRLTALFHYLTIHLRFLLKIK